MSTKGKRDFRPELHFTPPYGWTNDPNGLVYVNGTYHLFYQAYPFDTIWGPMHWGHAISSDLIHWTHQPIAMAPDELGMIFSGSAVLDKENTSGFGGEGEQPIVAMFTHHLFRGRETPGKEQQSIAYSLDGMHFTKYAGNPVIPSELPDFRDPKVFYNRIKGCWGMVLAAGDHVEFYASKDLKSWEKTGTFGPEGNYSAGVWECPDLFPLTVGGEEKWVLLVSMGASASSLGSRTQYFTGRFDGETFFSDGRFTQPEYIDSGFDCYAAVSYDNTDRRILFGWGDNPVYAGKTPTNEYCCQMTLPRVLTLEDTPLGGARLASTPKIDGVFGAGVPADKLDSEVFQLTVSGSGAAAVTLRNGSQSFRFGVNEQNEVFLDRSNAGDNSFSEVYASERFSRISAPRLYEGDWTIELIFDHSSAELYLDHGTRTLSAVLFPDTPYTEIVTEGDAAVLLHRRA